MDYFIDKITEEVESKWKSKYNDLLRELQDEKASYTNLLHEKQELAEKFDNLVGERNIILQANSELKQMVQEYRVKCGEINGKK